ncbi:MAG: peptide ABC transporter substrate-binding protein, partial [Chloroflexi bacterium]|nr:peptide ABC transporter substrate-binding protein [Chloroflexota bacterium]
MEKLDSIIDQFMQKKIDRRQLLVRAAALGLSVPAISAILAACGSESGTTSSNATSAPAAGTQPPATG